MWRGTEIPYGIDISKFIKAFINQINSWAEPCYVEVLIIEFVPPMFDNVHIKQILCEDPRNLRKGHIIWKTKIVCVKNLFERNKYLSLDVRSVFHWVSHCIYIKISEQPSFTEKTKSGPRVVCPNFGHPARTSSF